MKRFADRKIGVAELAPRRHAYTLPVVSESGIQTRPQIEELERVGVDAVLVGETVMRAPDPEAAVRTLSGTEEGTQA